MNISGLENNYYLSGNDNWISVNGLSEAVSYLELSAANTATGATIPAIRMQPSPDNDFQFNISAVIRALQPEPDHIVVNTMQPYSIALNATFVNSSTANDTAKFSKYFIRGGRDKDGTTEWHLNDFDNLIVGRWVQWEGVTLPGFAKKINGDVLSDFFPIDFFLVPRKGCDYKIVKFLNSLGAYQYFVFDSYENQNKPKADKTIDRITDRLRQDNFRNLGNSDVRTLHLYATTPAEIQEVYEDLVRSIDILLYEPSGNDRDAKWQRLILQSNESVRNNYDLVYDNKAVFALPTYVTRNL